MITDLKSLFQKRRLTFVLFVMISIFFIYDISDEILDDGLANHVIFEIMILLLTLWLLFTEIKVTFITQKQLNQEQQKAKKLSGELSQFISEQLKLWQLTKSETEVAWMMLKGFNFPEIAKYRNVKEKTVRQQAVAIYAKSETKNRIGFVGYFFEELLGNLQ